MSQFDVAILKDLRIIPIDIANGTTCNSAKCPLTRGFSRVFRKTNPTHYAEVGNYHTHIYQKLDRKPKTGFMHGDNLKAWIRHYDENHPVFPVTVEVVEDRNKVNWLKKVVIGKNGGVLQNIPPSDTHYLEIPNGEHEKRLMKEIREDFELPLTFEINPQIIAQAKPYPMLNPIAMALHCALGQKWSVAVCPTHTIIRRKGERTYSHIFLPNSHQVYEWLDGYNISHSALPINLVMTDKHIEKEGQDLLNK